MHNIGETKEYSDKVYICDVSGEWIQSPCSIHQVYENGTCHDLSVCGNGVIESIENCDDGNAVDNDGCSSVCEVF